MFFKVFAMIFANVVTLRKTEKSKSAKNKRGGVTAPYRLRKCGFSESKNSRCDGWRQRSRTF